jgi:glutamate dehydrogenase (NADP+)
MTDDEMFALDCDVLVPAAMEDQIHERNVNGITATVILEPANGTVTAGADKVLNKKGITVLPDILANAGGVSVSYYEWVQNRQGFSWTAEEVQARLKPLMESESMAVWRVAQTKAQRLMCARWDVCPMQSGLMGHRRIFVPQLNSLPGIFNDTRRVYLTLAAAD